MNILANVPHWYGFHRREDTSAKYDYGHCTSTLTVYVHYATGYLLINLAIRVHSLSTIYLNLFSFFVVAGKASLEHLQGMFKIIIKH
jgi:hypothetical protein